MYVGQIEEQKLTFVVSGKLWNRSLVMQDLETKSLWSHILGECMEGELKGQRLEIVPSSMTDWKSWKEQAPETTAVLMSRTSKNYNRDFYKQKPSAFAIGALLRSIRLVGSL